MPFGGIVVWVFQISDLGFHVGFQVSCFICRVPDFIFHISYFGCNTSDYMSRIINFILQVSCFIFHNSYLYVHISGVSVQDSGFKLQLSYFIS